MVTKVYNIELDWVIIEKIVMRVVVALIGYNCLV